MNNAIAVDNMIGSWQRDGLSSSEIVARAAEACLGWPYVFGAAGALCTPSNRRTSYNVNATRHPDEAKEIKKTCQVLSGGSGCHGCKFYPDDQAVRQFDCRGFTRKLLEWVGISLAGGGSNSQWNTGSNWTQKGEIRDMPLDQVCCVFWKSGSKMVHTGMHIGGGVIIHCSGVVKKGMSTDRGWTHYAIPKGLGGSVPMPATDSTKPTLRKGSRGEYVTLAQSILIQRGYSCGSAGADGIYGNDTQYAVKKYQLDNGLQMDGIIGPATWEALMNPKEITVYTVHIPGQPLYVAEALVKQYTGAWMTEEGKE